MLVKSLGYGARNCSSYNLTQHRSKRARNTSSLPTREAVWGSAEKIPEAGTGSHIQLCVCGDTTFPELFLAIVWVWQDYEDRLIPRDGGILGRGRKPLIGDSAPRLPVSFVKMIFHLQDQQGLLSSLSSLWHREPTCIMVRRLCPSSQYLLCFPLSVFPPLNLLYFSHLDLISTSQWTWTNTGNFSRLVYQC